MSSSNLYYLSQFKKIATIDDKYNLVRKIGKGATATVYMGYDTSKINGKQVEMYAFKVLKVVNDDILTSFNNEVSILSLLSSEDNSTYYQEHSSKSILYKKNGKKYDIAYIKIEYLSNGELFDYIFYPKKGLGENFSRLIFKSIIDEVIVIHNHNYAHRDLKTENIMLDDSFNVKICDYGFAIKNSNSIQSYCGTNGYLAPELLMNLPFNGQANDIFALGVILFVLVTGTMPFRTASPQDPYYACILRGEYEKFWSGCKCKLSENLMKLIDGMICFNAQERVSIAEIISSEWMKEGEYSEENYKVLKKELSKRKKKIIRKK